MLKPILILSALACAVSAHAQQLDATQMAAARAKSQVCFACHGPDGNSTVGEFFADQKQAPIKFQVDPAKVEAGRKTSDAVLCPMCHLGGFVGQNEIPRVAGQWPQYIKKQLADFKARRRTNDAGNMTSIAATLSDADIENLSQYIGNLY